MNDMTESPMRRRMFATAIALAALGVLAMVVLRSEPVTTVGRLGSTSAHPQLARPSTATTPTAGVAAANKSAVGRPDSIPSKAPWAAASQAFERREYRVLIANARTSPAASSYTLAARALTQCANLIENHERILKEIEKSTENRQLRLNALKVLREPCDGLGDVQTMVKERDALYAEGEKAGDALMSLAAESMKLGDPRLPKEVRQQRVQELLALDDADAFAYLRGALSGKGASFDGEPVKDHAVYAIALQMAECQVYGKCTGADSTSSHKDCAMHNHCRYLDTMAGLQYAVPPFMYEKAGQYFLRVRDRIAQQDYRSFGVP